MVKDKSSGVWLSPSASQLCHTLAVWPWALELTSLGLCIFICQLKSIVIGPFPQDQGHIESVSRESSASSLASRSQQPLLSLSKTRKGPVCGTDAFRLRPHKCQHYLYLDKIPDRQNLLGKYNIFSWKGLEDQGVQWVRFGRDHRWDVGAMQGHMGLGCPPRSLPAFRLRHG